MTQEHTIDAKGKKLGRVASEAANILMGKNDPSFQRHTLADTQVTIVNASQIDIRPKKLSQKTYIHNTGYPGGLRQRTMRQVIDRKGYEEVFKKAIYGMLPGNKLRQHMMKHITIVE